MNPSTNNLKQGDQREPHHSGRHVDEAYLSTLCVFYRNFSALNSVDELAKERGYHHRDVITVSPDAMGDVYEEKVKMFFNEHLHEDEEIRWIMDGDGYFDVRSEGDQWVRVYVEKNDLMILPAGIYHRFTTASNNVCFLLGFLFIFRFVFLEGPRYTYLV